MRPPAAHPLPLALILVFLALPGWGPPPAAAQAAPPSPAPHLRRGAQASVPGMVAAGDLATVRLFTAASFPAGAPDSTGAERAQWIVRGSPATDGTVAFGVPLTAPLGRYYYGVYASPGRADSTRPRLQLVASGTVVVTAADSLHITGVEPQVGYGPHGRADFTLRGEGFSPLPQENIIAIDGQPDLPLCGTARVRPEDCVTVALTPIGDIRVSNVPVKSYNWPMRVRVRVGEASDTASVMVSYVWRGVPTVAGLGTLLLLVLLVAYVLNRSPWPGTASGGSRTGLGAGRYHNLWQAAVLERDTQTYSLSKLQFYIWTFSAIFGYVYLLVSRSMVQGQLVIPDVPTGLPGILGISAGTGVLAIGLESWRGSKGAGEEHPSAADFLTTGGVVAAERLQFFVWTIIGAASFILSTVRTDPTLISSLPAVPDGFLQLMGVSSAGYLGGKVVRRPGPIVSKADATLVEEQQEKRLLLRLEGSNLSQDAVVKVDGEAVPPESLDLGYHQDSQGRPRILVPDDQPDMAKVLALKIAKENKFPWQSEAWQLKEHELTLVNPGGQRATVKFQLGGPFSVQLTCSLKPGQQATVGQPLTVEAQVLGGVTSDRSIAWSSSAPKVATVEAAADAVPAGAQAVITPVAVGKATITATANVDTTKSATLELAVAGAPAPAGGAGQEAGAGAQAGAGTQAGAGQEAARQPDGTELAPAGN